MKHNLIMQRHLVYSLVVALGLFAVCAYGMPQPAVLMITTEQSHGIFAQKQIENKRTYRYLRISEEIDLSKCRRTPLKVDRIILTVWKFTEQFFLLNQERKEKEEDLGERKKPKNANLEQTRWTNTLSTAHPVVQNQTPLPNLVDALFQQQGSSDMESQVMEDFIGLHSTHSLN